MTSRDVSIRPEGVLGASESEHRDTATIRIEIPASLLEPGRQYVFTVGVNRAEPDPEDLPPTPAPQALAA